MGQINRRLLSIPDLKLYSTFLWGPRKVGKSWYIKNNIQEDVIYVDLLQSDTFAEYLTNPKLLREKYQHLDFKRPIVIDEIQKCPAFLDEVHWMIENCQ